MLPLWAWAVFAALVLLDLYLMAVMVEAHRGRVDHRVRWRSFWRERAIGRISRAVRATGEPARPRSRSRRWSALTWTGRSSRQFAKDWDLLGDFPAFREAVEAGLSPPTIAAFERLRKVGAG